MKDKTIEQKVRETGDGTAHTEYKARCSYRNKCAYENERCKPDTCHWISPFYYRGVERP